MAPSTAEERLRAGLRIVRFANAYLPLPLMRWVITQSVKRATLPAGVRRESISADGVPCEWIIPPESASDQVLLYLHGGGFVLGLTSLHMEMVAVLARKMGVRALMVDYRLAPEHPFPSGLDDCVTAYRWLLQQGVPAKNIVIAGDSAGGNFTLTTLMKLRDEGDPLPAAGACLSPVADLGDKAGLFEKVHDPILHPRAAKFYNRSYVGQNDAANPLISPVFGDWQGLPPLLVHAGEDEILRKDALRIEELAREAGVEIQVEIYPRMWHVWQLNLELPQATQSLDAIAEFLMSHSGIVTKP
jgi:acetyl esterase/lipase